MDTPERSKNTQIATSIGEFEDSPVFNFLNSLSPIKPVKSIHVTQIINPLSFASLPSVFSSPHSEPRFLRRHQFPDPSEPEFSSDDGETVDTNNDVQATMNLDEQKENVDCENVKLVVDFAESLDCDSETVNSSLSSVEGNFDNNKWDSLIADESKPLLFESPNIESYNKSIDPAINHTQPLDDVVCNERNIEESEAMPSQPLEGGELIGNGGKHEDSESFSGLYRGMRRRCLVFEMAGASSNQQIVRSKTENESSRVLTGIGLHLNALTATSKDFKIGNRESSSSGRVLIGSSSSADFPRAISSQDLLSNTIDDYSLERDTDKDSSPESGLIANVDINPISPKKRRRRLDQTGEGESCKRCNCKKSKCLKLYCECFAAGVYCVEPCACIDCFNKPIHEETVLATRRQIESRNPLAFAPKVIGASDSLPEIGDDLTNTPASARHKRGCNCKKSGCLKKYCECYQGGVGCSINCRCEGCKNAFGRKDGSCSSATEHEHEVDATEKAKLDASLHKAAIHDDFEQCMEKRPPRATFPSISSYSGLSDGHDFGKSSLFPKRVGEVEMPSFLQGGSPVKSSSPKGKRVLPPQTRSFEVANSGLRSSRKLILRSIPSFPSLAKNR